MYYMTEKRIYLQRASEAAGSEDRALPGAARRLLGRAAERFAAGAKERAGGHPQLREGLVDRPAWCHLVEFAITIWS